MAEDSSSEPTVKTFPRHKAATIGRLQGDKRRAVANLPSWNEVNAMYSEEETSDSSGASQEANRRWSMLPTPSAPLALDSSLDGTQFDCNPRAMPLLLMYYPSLEGLRPAPESLMVPGFPPLGPWQLVRLLARLSLLHILTALLYR